MRKRPMETGNAFTSKNNQRHQIPDIEIKKINTPIKQDNIQTKPKQRKNPRKLLPGITQRQTQENKLQHTLQ